jgi:exopolysaccharide production protein ExoY
MSSKRFFDILLSTLILFFGAPLFFLCGLLVKLSSSGPIFHSCTRVGRSGRLFRCWKFRTMVADADEILPMLLASNTTLLNEWRTFYKLKQDPRVTPIGKWLRKTSLDELPQFWNVLRGDMSVVGPRPLTKKEVEDYLREKAAKILSLRPGLTSLWAVSGRNEMSFDKRVDLEEQYVDNRSLWLDAKVIIMTFPAVFTSRGAF